MNTELTCIICPMGCTLTITRENGQLTVTGNTCPRGARYGMQEVTCPVRVVTSSVRLTDGETPVVSVKTSAAVPKSMIPAVLRAIRDITASAPVAIGDILASHIGGTDSDLIATTTAPAR